MDGQKANYSGCAGMSAPAKPVTARQIRNKTSCPSYFAQNSDQFAFCDSLNNCFTTNYCFGEGYADLPHYFAFLING